MTDYVFDLERKLEKAKQLIARKDEEITCIEEEIARIQAQTNKVAKALKGEGRSAADIAELMGLSEEVVAAL